MQRVACTLEEWASSLLRSAKPSRLVSEPEIGQSFLLGASELGGREQRAAVRGPSGGVDVKSVDEAAFDFRVRCDERVRAGEPIEFGSFDAGFFAGSR